MIRSAIYVHQLRHAKAIDFDIYNVNPNPYIVIYLRAEAHRNRTTGFSHPAKLRNPFIQNVT